MSNNNFDLSKPTFDLFSLRNVRNDALLQYSTLNQSEPLRINLFLTLTLFLFSFPTINETVAFIGDGSSSLAVVAASVVGGIGSSFLFVRECQKRSKQLNRMEKELNAEVLKVKLPTRNKLDPRLYAGQNTVILKKLRSNYRVFAICGPTDVLKEALVEFRVLRRRLGQSNALVIGITTDNENNLKPDDFRELDVTEREIRTCQWLGQAQDKSVWDEYFKGLISNVGDDKNNEDELIWFGLNYSGRSFASGVDKPRLLEIMGQYLRPIEVLDEDDESEEMVGLDVETQKNTNNVLDKQAKFYEALTRGDLEGIKDICAFHNAEEVTKVINEGGRLDNWEACLAEGARPADMKISGSDILLQSPTKAYSTTIEFPSNSVYSGSVRNTLLSVQRWHRDSLEEEWKLECHQTIPWTEGSRAGGTLKCDGRGCVALSRKTE